MFAMTEIFMATFARILAKLCYAQTLAGFAITAS